MTTQEQIERAIMAGYQLYHWYRYHPDAQKRPIEKEIKEIAEDLAVKWSEVNGQNN